MMHVARLEALPECRIYRRQPFVLDSSAQRCQGCRRLLQSAGRVRATPGDPTPDPAETPQGTVPKTGLLRSNSARSATNPLRAAAGPQLKLSDPVQTISWGGRVPSTRRAVIGSLTALGIGKIRNPYVCQGCCTAFTAASRWCSVSKQLKSRWTADHNWP